MRESSPPPKRVTCHMPCVMCHMPRVTCFVFFVFFWQSDEVYRGRVFNQRGLPRLVLMDTDPQSLPKPQIFGCIWSVGQNICSLQNTLMRVSCLSSKQPFSLAHNITDIEGASLLRYYHITACLYHLLNVNCLTVNCLTVKCPAVNFLTIEINQKRIYYKKGVDLARFHAQTVLTGSWNCSKS